MAGQRDVEAPVGTEEEEEEDNESVDGMLTALEALQKRVAFQMLLKCPHKKVLDSIEQELEAVSLRGAKFIK
jgi:hypothetical protein